MHVSSYEYIIENKSMEELRKERADNCKLER